VFQKDEETIDVLSTRHLGLIPEGHPDRKKIAQHINNLRTSNPNEARRLYDRFISGGGSYIKDKSEINIKVNKSENNINLTLKNHFEGSSTSPTEYHYSVHKNGDEIGRAIVFDKDPRSIHSQGKEGASLKDIRIKPEHHGKGYSEHIINSLVEKHGPLASDSRGNISEAGHKMFSKYGSSIKSKENKDLYMFGGSVKKYLSTEKLPLYSEYIEPLQKGEKFPHFLNFMGNHPKARETAQWVDENIKHRNLAELAMRHAKTKPEGLNDEEKTHIKHFNDSLHMPEVQKAAGSITSQHDFSSGIELLKEAESAYQKRHAKEAPTLVSTEGEKLLDFGDGVGVYRLPLNADRKNKNEATAMGHCATPHKGGELWSIRRDHGNGMVEPLISISHEGGYLGEMKGKHNWKPSAKHHGHIAKLLASDKIKGFVGGGYAPESNFEISDLSEGFKNKLLEYKPSLIQKVYKENLPEGFQGDYNHTPEIKSIFSTSDLAAQQKYLAKISENTDQRRRVLWSAATNPHTHPDILHKLAEDSDQDVVWSVSHNPNTHPDTLHKLAEDSDYGVLWSVSTNPNTHPDTLHKLAEDPGYELRENVALHPNTHPDTLHKLAEDPYVRKSVATNPQFKNLPLEIQQKVRPLVNTPIQKIIAMINDGENNPDPAHEATEELKLRRQEKYDKILSPEGNLSDIQHLSESHNNNIARRARNELKRRGLQKSDLEHSLEFAKKYKSLAKHAVDQGDKEGATKYMKSLLIHLQKSYQFLNNERFEKSQKNHPKGGLSRKEAKKHGIHAGIETHDEVKRKGGVSKLSNKTSARRRSFCARHCGMKRKFPKAYKDRQSKGNKALRVWHCGSCSNWLKKSIGADDTIKFYEDQDNLIIEFDNDVPHEIETLVVASILAKGFKENE